MAAKRTVLVDTRVSEAERVVSEYDDAIANWHSTRQAVVDEVLRLRAAGAQPTEIMAETGLSWQRYRAAITDSGSEFV